MGRTPFLEFLVSTRWLPQSPGRRLAAAVGPAVAVVILLAPLPALSPEAHRLAAILAWVILYWVTEPIPLPATAVAGTLLSLLTGLDTWWHLLTFFVHPIVFLLIGSFLLAKAMAVHRLDRRFALSVLSQRAFHASPMRTLGALGVATAAISMWISNAAATALMTPVALGILAVLREGTTPVPARAQAGTLLLLSYAATAGGMMTLVGTPPNLLGVGLITEQTGTAIAFLTWMAAGLPLGILLLTISFGVISSHWASVNLETTDLQQRLRGQGAALGSWTGGQTTTCLVFGLALAGWLLPGILQAALGPAAPLSSWLSRSLAPEIVAIGAAALLFVVPTSLKDGATTLRWPDIFRINWGILLLFGGGLALGHLTMRTGLGEVAGRGIVWLAGVESVWSLTAGAIAMAVLVSELVSNTVAASMVIPIVIAIAQAAGVSPVPPALGACFASSLGFLLPVSTAPNAIVYATGLVPLSSMIRAGIYIDLFGALSIWIVLRLLLPILGLA